MVPSLKKKERRMGEKKANPNLDNSMRICNKAYFETHHFQVEFLENAKRIDDLTTGDIVV